MPPPDSHLSLTEDEQALLTRWVAEGAEYRGHWSLEPVRAGVPPASPVNERALHPVDAFVRARLEQDGLRPAPRARPETLLRRLAQNLTGLPPLPAEVDQFLADPSPEAYARAVDRYLASPRYGERMAADSGRKPIQSLLATQSSITFRFSMLRFSVAFQPPSFGS